MDLKAAGELLGITPNAVRARAKNRQAPVIRYEKDNSQKWWVFIDPEKAANERAQTEAKIEPQTDAVSTSNAASNEAVFEAENRLLRAHLETLQGTVSDLRGRLDESVALNRSLIERDQGATAQAAAAAAELARLQAMNDGQTAEIRNVNEILREYLAKRAADASKPGLLSLIAQALKRSPERS